MKVFTTITSFLGVFISLLISANEVDAQQYKLKQVTSTSGMKSESTIYVKGPRKRTEGGGYMGMGANLVTIEQCDLQRTIRINDKKKLYLIEPFSKESEEKGEDDIKPAAKTKNTSPVVQPKNGGVIYMYYNITDTGERKKMFGITARHVWSTQKMKPSADACMMKDSMLIKTDGWYIDLPQFNCQEQYSGRAMSSKNTIQPECRDRFVSKRTGKGRLGFPLIETKTMIMGGQMQTTEYVTNIETLELSMVKLDSMLFEIPLGYQETKNEEDLQDKFDVNTFMNQSGSNNINYNKAEAVNPSAPKKSGSTRIGVLQPVADEAMDMVTLQKHLVINLNGNNIEAIAVNDAEEAKKYKCDLLLNTNFTKLKQASKVGSLIKAIKNTDPTATTSFNVEAVLSLTKLTDGSKHSEEKVSGKFDGKSEEAAKKAIEKGSTELLSSLE